MNSSLLASVIVAKARALLGVPWRHRGRNQNGLDCIGLVLLALLSAGWKPKNMEAVARLDYDRTSTADELLAVLGGEGVSVALCDKTRLDQTLQAGDVVVFRFPDHTWTQHMGLVTASGADGVYFIHARATGDKSTSRVVEHSLADGWLEALDAAFRIEGVMLHG